MYKPESNATHGNDRYEGYVIDLIEELAKLLKFKYEFFVPAYKDYGSRIPGTQNQWSGMIGEVKNGVRSTI